MKDTTVKKKIHFKLLIGMMKVETKHLVLKSSIKHEFQFIQIISICCLIRPYKIPNSVIQNCSFSLNQFVKIIQNIYTPLKKNICTICYNLLEMFYHPYF